MSGTRSNHRTRVLSPIPGYRDGQRGAALVELAFLLPLLIVMILGIIDFGRLIHARLVMTNVSREGGSLGSRDIRVGSQLVSMLQTSAAPFNLGGAEGRIYVTKIRAGESLLDPEPYIHSRATGGTLDVPSGITGNVGDTPGGLQNPIYGHLRFREANNTSDISEVTIVEVFYLYRTITPLPEFVQGLILPDRGGILIGSRATF
ncbi:MAG TPA: pilus assembly protein [Syntrophales bacterium]|nr:pilus assembly protein [Syntrophales bacterium]HQL90632.1 pilus assembly protein [Syntrophales bacterium]